ncbi:MAG: glycosyltransferase family 4 protein [Candidatus Eisenbacteria bacterium]|nr:glycosyltransferase family 4 protein [Candidatus Eisenbacteria bacterium]
MNPAVRKLPLHLVLSTDASVADILRLGMGPYFKKTLAAYSHEFAVDLYSADARSFSVELGVDHRPLLAGLPAALPRPLEVLIYYRRLVRAADRMSGLVRVLSSNLAVLPEMKRRGGGRGKFLVDLRYDWARTTQAYYGGAKKLFASRMQSRCLLAADLVIATTPLLASVATRGYGRRAIVVPNPVDRAMFRPAPNRRPTILYAGRLHPGKGVGLLIDAFGRIARERDGVELLILGTGEEHESLERKAEREVPGRRVRFLGSRPQDEVAQHLGSALVLVLPSLVTEGNPKIVLEALASGTPIVATRVPGNTDLIEDGRQGLLVPPGDVNALYRALSRILEDEALRASLGREGLRASRRYDAERVLRNQCLSLIHI